MCNKFDKWIRLSECLFHLPLYREPLLARGLNWCSDPAGCRGEASIHFLFTGAHTHANLYKQCVNILTERLQALTVATSLSPGPVPHHSSPLRFSLWLVLYWDLVIRLLDWTWESVN